MPHWRSLMDPSDYVQACDLFRGDVTVEIAEVRAVKLPRTQKIRERTKPVLSFVRKKKKLIVGATIGNTIARLYGPDTDQWVGKRITLYASTTRGSDGEEVECVRVRPVVPGAPVTASKPSNVTHDGEVIEERKEGEGELAEAEGAMFGEEDDGDVD